MWALLPLALGWQTTTVMTGSMEPRISAGDVIISRPVPAGAAGLGHVLLVDDPDHAGRLRLHRYVDNAPDGSLILRGDANTANDSTPVSPAAVHGVAVLRVPYVGLPVVWLAEKNWVALGAVAAGISLLTVAAAAGSGAGPDNRPAPGSAGSSGNAGPSEPRHTPGTRRGARRRSESPRRSIHSVRALLVLASLPVLIAPELLLATPAHAAFSAVAAPGSGSFAAAETYDCLDPTVGFGPSLFYPFNEAATATAVDFSGNRRNGALGGGAARVFGSCAPGDSPALDLSNPGALVSTPQLVDAPNSFSIAVWFKSAPGAAPGGRLLGFGDTQTGASAQSDRHLYMTNTGGIGFGVITRNGQSDQYKAESVVAAGPYNDGRWHLAVGTIDPGQGAVLYVDGVPMSYGKNIVAERPYKGYWRVGYDSMDFTAKKDWPGAPTDMTFRGAVDNAAVYASVLTPAQIQSLYNGGR